MTEHFWLGMAIIFVGGALNGSFALPMKYVRSWRHENTWLVFTAIALLILPWVLAAGFVSNLGSIFHAASARALFLPLTFGLLWGVAMVTFGIGLSAVGIALAFTVVAGLSCVFGSLIPLLVLHPADLFRPRGLLLLASLPLLVLGLVCYGTAGRRREKQQAASEQPSGVAPLSFLVGLGVCIFTGIFGANINLGFAFGGELLRKSLEQGASTVTSTYPVWALVLGAGFIPNMIYCCYLLFRNRTWSVFGRKGAGFELFLAIVMALLWLGGMVGYGIGANLVGKFGTSLGYALTVTAAVLASNTIGVLTGEWKGVSYKTKRLVVAAVVLVLASAVVLNLGGLF